MSFNVNNTYVYFDDDCVSICWDKADPVDFDSIEEAISYLEEVTSTGSQEWWVEENRQIIKRLKRLIR